MASFWFPAALVALLGPVLAAGSVSVDQRAGRAGVFPTLFISPDSARLILGTIAGSLITVAALTSSLTIVTLQLLSSQYSPRAVRGFLRRRLAQVVFGSFVAIFAYCLLVMATVREPANENRPFVPSLSVCVAIVLALTALGLLIAFIHLMTQTIQVSTTMAALARSTTAAIDAAHPGRWEPSRVDRDGKAPPDPSVAPPGLLYAARPGYVRWIDTEGLAHVLGEHQRVELLVCPGDFVTTRTPLASVWPKDGVHVEAVLRNVRVSPERDLDQDPAFGLRQLADIALRAISPGINDPTTAVTCIGFLQDVLERLTERELPTHRATGPRRNVLARGRTFESYVEVLVQIGRYATSDSKVVVALLDALIGVARSADAVDAPERARLAAGLAAEIAELAFADSPSSQDRARVAERLATLGAGPGGPSRAASALAST